MGLVTKVVHQTISSTSGLIAVLQESVSRPFFMIKFALHEGLLSIRWHICDMAWICHLHAPDLKPREKNAVMLGTALPAPTDAKLDLVNKG